MAVLSAVHACARRYRCFRGTLASFELERQVPVAARECSAACRNRLTSATKTTVSTGGAPSSLDARVNARPITSLGRPLVTCPLTAANKDGATPDMG
jgi:hypothetical protein